GSYGSNDFLYLIFYENKPTLWARVGSGQETRLYSNVTVNVGSAAFVYAGWNGDALELSVNGGPKLQGTRIVPPTGISDASVYFGHDRHGQQHANVAIGPVLIFDRPLN